MQVPAAVLDAMGVPDPAEKRPQRLEQQIAHIGESNRTVAEGVTQTLGTVTEQNEQSSRKLNVVAVQFRGRNRHIQFQQNELSCLEEAIGTAFPLYRGGGYLFYKDRNGEHIEIATNNGVDTMLMYFKNVKAENQKEGKIYVEVDDEDPPAPAGPTLPLGVRQRTVADQAVLRFAPVRAINRPFGQQQQRATGRKPLPLCSVVTPFVGHCPFFFQGNCTAGDACRYSHEQVEQVAVEADSDAGETGQTEAAASIDLSAASETPGTRPIRAAPTTCASALGVALLAPTTQSNGQREKRAHRATQESSAARSAQAKKGNSSRSDTTANSSDGGSQQKRAREEEAADHNYSLTITTKVSSEKELKKRKKLVDNLRESLAAAGSDIPLPPLDFSTPPPPFDHRFSAPPLSTDGGGSTQQSAAAVPPVGLHQQIPHQLASNRDKQQPIKAAANSAQVNSGGEATQIGTAHSAAEHRTAGLGLAGDGTPPPAPDQQQSNADAMTPTAGMGQQAMLQQQHQQQAQMIPPQQRIDGQQQPPQAPPVAQSPQQQQPHQPQPGVLISEEEARKMVGVCPYFMRTGTCNYRDGCKFAHDEGNITLGVQRAMRGVNISGGAPRGGFRGARAGREGAFGGAAGPGGGGFGNSAGGGFRGPPADGEGGGRQGDERRPQRGGASAASGGGRYDLSPIRDREGGKEGGRSFRDHRRFRDIDDDRHGGGRRRSRSRSRDYDRNRRHRRSRSRDNKNRNKSSAGGSRKHRGQQNRRHRGRSSSSSSRDTWGSRLNLRDQRREPAALAMEQRRESRDRRQQKDSRRRLNTTDNNEGVNNGRKSGGGRDSSRKSADRRGRSGGNGKERRQRRSTSSSSASESTSDSSSSESNSSSSSKSKSPPPPKDTSREEEEEQETPEKTAKSPREEMPEDEAEEEMTPSEETKTTKAKSTPKWKAFGTAIVDEQLPAEHEQLGHQGQQQMEQNQQQPQMGMDDICIVEGGPEKQRPEKRVIIDSEGEEGNEEVE